MIIGFVVKCDRCSVSMLAKLNEMSFTTSGDRMDVLDRYVCDDCIAKHEEEREELLA